MTPSTKRGPIDPALAAVALERGIKIGTPQPHQATKASVDFETSPAVAKMRLAAKKLALLPLDERAAAARELTQQQIACLGWQNGDRVRQALSATANLAAYAAIAAARNMPTVKLLKVITRGARLYRRELARSRERSAKRQEAELQARRQDRDPYNVLYEDAALSQIRPYVLANLEAWQARGGDYDAYARRAEAAWLASEGRWEGSGILPPDPAAVAKGETRPLAVEGQGAGGIDWGALNLRADRLEMLPIQWDGVTFSSSDHELFGAWQRALEGADPAGNLSPRAIVADVRLKDVDGQLILLVEDGAVLPLFQHRAENGTLQTVLPPRCDNPAVIDAVVEVWKADVERLGITDQPFRVSDSVIGLNAARAAIACAEHGIPYSLADEVMAPFADRLSVNGFDVGNDRLSQAALATAMGLQEGVWPDFAKGAFKDIAADPDRLETFLRATGDAMDAMGSSAREVAAADKGLRELASLPSAEMALEAGRAYAVLADLQMPEPQIQSGQWPTFAGGRSLTDGGFLGALKDYPWPAQGYTP